MWRIDGLLESIVTRKWKKMLSKKWIIIYQLIVTIIFGVAFILSFGLILGVGGICFVALLEFFLIKNLYSKISLVNVHIFDCINSLAGSLCFAGSIGIIIKKWMLDSSLIKIIFFAISLAFLLWGLFLHMDLHVKKELLEKKKSRLTIVGLSAGLLILLFVLFVNIPSELYLGNSSEFECSYWDVQSSFLPFFLVAFILSFLSLLPEKFLKVFFVIVSGTTINIYIQKMFFNRFVGEITGAHYYWAEHILYALINLFIWIALFGICFYLIFLKKKSVYIIFAEGAVLLLLSVSLISIFIRTPKESYQRKQYYLEPSEQFTVGKEKNVIILIADAVDNEFIYELYEKKPDCFEPYNDFTMYADTCSVYDTTGNSICQMLYGYTQKEDTEIVEPFFNRFRDAGYRVLFFHAAAITNGLKYKVGKYIDNFVYTEQTKDIERVKYDKIRNAFLRLDWFLAAPCVVKKYARTETVDLKGWINYTTSIYEVVNDNKGFENALHLEYNEKSDSCLIYQHIDGTHFPCDDYLDETEYCLKIFSEYIKQLKDLGVYDDSVIIVAADHGLHDDAEGIPYGTVSTPMLLIKSMEEHHDSMIISKRPVYYRDFQASMLEYAGLYDEECRGLFGKTFNDYGEDEVRTRIWFDQGFINANSWRKYTYRGNYNEFKRVINDGEYEEVKNGSFDFSSIKE